MALKGSYPTLDKVKPDEPIFVLRAQDITAPEVITFWVAINAQLSDAKRNEALRCADAMRTYRNRKRAD